MIYLRGPEEFRNFNWEGFSLNPKSWGFTKVCYSEELLKEARKQAEQYPGICIAFFKDENGVYPVVDKKSKLTLFNAVPLAKGGVGEFKAIEINNVKTWVMFFPATIF